MPLDENLLTKIDPDDLEEYIEAIVEEKTKYLRTYDGTVMVNIDPEGNGRVKLMIYELGWIDPSTWSWARPEFPGIGSWMIPSIASRVKVYFQRGDPDDPVYRGQHYYTLDKPIVTPTGGIIFESPFGLITIEYEESIGQLTLNGVIIKLGLGTQPILRGIATIAAIDAMIAAGVGAGGPALPSWTAAQVAWNALKAALLSTKILGE